MSLISRLMQGLTGTGAHRAADRIPVLEAERDRWLRLAAAWQEQTTHADRLVTKVCREKAALVFENARLAAELERFTEGHEELSAAYDELTARFTEVSAALANARAVSSPAPADFGPPIALPTYDPDATEEIFAGPLWDINALKKTAA